MSNIVITVTKVNTNNIAGNNFRYRSFGDVFVNIDTESLGTTRVGEVAGNVTVAVVLSGTVVGFGGLSLALSSVSTGISTGASSGSGFSCIFYLF